MHFTTHAPVLALYLPFFSGGACSTHSTAVCTHGRQRVGGHAPCVRSRHRESDCRESSRSGGAAVLVQCVRSRHCSCCAVTVRRAVWDEQCWARRYCSQLVRDSNAAAFVVVTSFCVTLARGCCCGRPHSGSAASCGVAPSAGGGAEEAPETGAVLHRVLGAAHTQARVCGPLLR